MQRIDLPGPTPSFPPFRGATACRPGLQQKGEQALLQINPSWRSELLPPHISVVLNSTNSFSGFAAQCVPAVAHIQVSGHAAQFSVCFSSFAAQFVLAVICLEVGGHICSSGFAAQCVVAEFSGRAAYRECIRLGSSKCFALSKELILAIIMAQLMLPSFVFLV